eukprot:gene6045-biopygen14865
MCGRGSTEGVFQVPPGDSDTLVEIALGPQFWREDCSQTAVLAGKLQLERSFGRKSAARPQFWQEHCS